MSLFCVVYFCRDVFLCTRKLWLLSEHHVVVNERQICLQKGGESVCDLSWGMQQGQGTDPSCRSGSVSHRGSDRVCASGLAQVQGKAPATDEAQNISIPLVYKLLPSFCWRTGCYLHILSNFPQGSVWFWDEAKNKQKNLCHKAGSTVLPVGLVLCLALWLQRFISGASLQVLVCGDVLEEQTHLMVHQSACCKPWVADKKQQSSFSWILLNFPAVW